MKNKNISKSERQVTPYDIFLNNSPLKFDVFDSRCFLSIAQSIIKTTNHYTFSFALTPIKNKEYV